ncbi:isoprenylcysteine carboxylmethyltransferase family protein [Rasiella rasia]|uniref:Isoprenylcysteine carboxylmethyltransferase family protein n=1 Tax=Rasiella rasia TaxID=2744027 RepID=A0A6G6GHS6_9FLAO|nr:isoprenylcysteine carboxylmethyltransferase family protein [Rasiella rasia]QIE58099.1 isoprenylcysteine carboxylmethyltransferase family protein [Rasiella rasia]
MKKDCLYIFIQFSLFAIYFIDWGWLSLSLPQWIIYPSLAGTFLGVVTVILGIINLNENISPFPSPKNNSVLISTGIYKYIRHPIYSGILVGLMGYAFYSFSLFKLLVVLLLGLVFYFKSSFEEKLLVKRYEAYSEYKKRTGRFFPKLQL